MSFTIRLPGPFRREGWEAGAPVLKRDYGAEWKEEETPNNEMGEDVQKHFAFGYFELKVPDLRGGLPNFGEILGQPAPVNVISED